MNKNWKAKIGLVSITAFIIGWIVYPMLEPKKELNPEDAIIEKINILSSYIEDSKISSIMSILASDFNSSGALSVSNKEQLYPLVSRMMGLYAPLHGVAISPQVFFVSELEASSDMEYVLSGENDTGLFSQKSKRFKVELNWIKVDNDWKISSAKIFEVK